MSSYEAEDRALVCPYCFKTFREPVKLPCGHNLCSECVGRIRRGAETSRETRMKLNEEGECEDVCDVKTLCPVCEKEFSEGDETSILAWRIPRTEKPGGLQSMGSQKSQTRLSN